MNCIKNKILSFVEKAKDKFNKTRPSKEDQDKSLWINCPGCKQMQLKEDLRKKFNICKCSFHFDLDPKIKFEHLLFDNGDWESISCPSWSNPDPLGFTVNGKKFIDKYKNYQKKTGQESALLIGHGKIGGLKAVAVGYNFSFGGAAFSQRENEHFLASAQFALENKVDVFVSIYQSGGKNVQGNLHSLKSMSTVQMAHTMLKQKNIVNIGILESKITGGTFVDAFGNQFLFAIKNSTDNLFSGKRVSASVRSSDSAQMPEDFGTSSFLERSGMCDGVIESRLDMKEKIVTLTKVLLKKAEQVKNKSNVKVDKSIQTAS